MLSTVQVSLVKKLRIISLLAIRLVYVVFPLSSARLGMATVFRTVLITNSVVIAVAFQIHYYIILVRSADKTWAQMNASIWDQ